MIGNNTLYSRDNLGVKKYECPFLEWLKWLYDSVKTGVETTFMPAVTEEMMGATFVATEIVTTPNIYLAKTKRLANEVGEGLDTQLRMQELFEKRKNKELISEIGRRKRMESGK